MTDRELLEMAQEAITWASDRLDPIGDPCTCPLCAAEIALHMRLAREDNGGKTGWAPGMLQDDDSKLSKWLANRPGAKRDAMAAREEQEPVAQQLEQVIADQLKQFYTAPQPAAREWVGLTDEDVDEAARYCVKSGQSVNATIRAIEAKLKEKNS